MERSNIAQTEDILLRRGQGKLKHNALHPLTFNMDLDRPHAKMGKKELQLFKPTQSNNVLS